MMREFRSILTYFAISFVIISAFETVMGAAAYFSGTFDYWRVIFYATFSSAFVAMVVFLIDAIKEVADVSVLRPMGFLGFLINSILILGLLFLGHALFF